MAFQRIGSSATLSESVERQISQEILDGNLKVNQQLPSEAQLGTSFGVSRTVVREALQRLEAQGLVQTRVGSGNYVASYPIAHVRTAMGRFAAMNPRKETYLHLSDLRQLIEAETSVRFARRRDPVAIADLGTIVNRMKECSGRTNDFIDADMAFHLRIAQDSDNPYFSAILEATKGIVKEFGLATYDSAIIFERTCREHEAILESATRGDADATRAKMLGHLAFSRSHYLEMLARRTESRQGDKVTEA